MKHKLKNMYKSRKIVIHNLKKMKEPMEMDAKITQMLKLLDRNLHLL